MNNWKETQREKMSIFREALNNMLNYGFSGDTGLWTIYEGSEIVYETEEYGMYANRLAGYGVEL